jgi:hypothetical protein
VATGRRAVTVGGAAIPRRAIAPARVTRGLARACATNERENLSESKMLQIRFQKSNSVQDLRNSRPAIGAAPTRAPIALGKNMSLIFQRLAVFPDWTLMGLEAV